MAMNAEPNGSARLVPGPPESAGALPGLPHPVVVSPAAPALPSSIAGSPALALQDERRREPRYPVDARAVLLLVKSSTAMPGRLLDLSMNGCQVRTQEHFTLGIFVRVEVEFDLRGMRFRLSGVTQSIHDVRSVGIRFLAVSERAQGQLAELIQELAAGK
jgi:PilZ domain